MHPLHTLGAADEVHRGGVEMDEIGDDLAGNAIVGQNGAQHAGRAVVQPDHPVEGVRGDCSPAVDGRLGGVIVRARVPERDGDAQRPCLADDGQPVPAFRRQRQDADAAAGRVPEYAQLLHGGRLEVLGPLPAAVFHRQERTLKMDALHPRAARAGRHHHADAAEGIQNVLVGGGGHGGDDGRDALLRLERRDLADPLRPGAAEAVAQRAVEVRVDEAGNQKPAGPVDFLQAGAVRPPDFGNHAVPNGDRGVGKGKVVPKHANVFKKPVFIHMLTP